MQNHWALFDNMAIPLAKKKSVKNKAPAPNNKAPNNKAPNNKSVRQANS